MERVTCSVCGHQLDADASMCDRCLTVRTVGIDAFPAAQDDGGRSGASDEPDARDCGPGPASPHAAVPCRVCGNEVTGDACAFCGAPRPVRAGGSRQWRLVFADGGSIPLVDATTTVIGRECGDPRIDARLTSDAVSRLHASLELRGNRLVVRDLESTNHTWLNGELVGSDPLQRDLPVTLRLGQEVIVEVRE
jgi:hypothetical protein